MFDIKKRSMGRRFGVPAAVYRCRRIYELVAFWAFAKRKIKWAGYVSEDVIVDERKLASCVRYYH